MVDGLQRQIDILRDDRERLQERLAAPPLHAEKEQDGDVSRGGLPAHGVPSDPRGVHNEPASATDPDSRFGAETDTWEDRGYPPPPTPGSAEWWQEVALALGVECFQLRRELALIKGEADGIRDRRHDGSGEPHAAVDAAAIANLRAQAESGSVLAAAESCVRTAGDHEQATAHATSSLRSDAEGRRRQSVAAHVSPPLHAEKEQDGDVSRGELPAHGAPSDPRVNRNELVSDDIDWRGWVQFVFLNGGEAKGNTSDLRQRVCEAVDQMVADARDAGFMNGRMSERIRVAEMSTRQPPPPHADVIAETVVANAPHDADAEAVKFVKVVTAQPHAQKER
jgi:hypothetical protein